MLLNKYNTIKLNVLDIDPRMLEQMLSGNPSVDKFISHDGGIPSATNIMVCGGPGIGKNTILLDITSGIIKNGYKGLFISGEMGRKHMYKYTKRFPQFGTIDTLFTSDYPDANLKDVIEQIVNTGWNIILLDSMAEIVDGVRADNNWTRKEGEKWLIDLCTKNNNGHNMNKKYSSFLLIQQMTKGGDPYGSNKLKQLTDATLFLYKDKDGSRYMEFDKNRDGEVEQRIKFNITNNKIEYENNNIEEKTETILLTKRK